MRARLARDLAIPEFGGAPTVLIRNTAYESGARTKRTAQWHAPTSTPNDGVLGNLFTLRDRSRQAARNDGNAKGALDKLVTNIIGTGIVPRSKAPDADVRKAIDALFLRWTDQSDADGLLDFYGQQAQMVRCWLEAGDAFARLRPRLPSDGLVVPLQIQVLEPELCPHSYSLGQLPNGNRVRAAIEFNGIGQRVAYYFHPSRPGDLQDYDAGTLTRIPSDRIAHLYDPLRAGQLRGIPILTAALVKLWELDKFDDATLLRQQLANMFVAFLTRQPGGTDSAPLDPLNNQPIADGETHPIVPLRPGLFQELEPGEDVTFSDPPDVGQTYPDFMRQQLRGAATAVGIPYELLTGDMTGLNDRTIRVLLIEFRRRMQMLQHHFVVFQLCRPIWNAWMDAAFLAGALPLPSSYATDPEPWRAVRFQPQGWPYLQPVQDVEAKRDAIRDGLTTRSAEVSETGEDAESIDEEQAADNERADRLGLKYDSDGRNPLTAGAVKNTASAGAPAGQGASA